MGKTANNNDQIATKQKPKKMSQKEKMLRELELREDQQKISKSIQQGLSDLDNQTVNSGIPVITQYVRKIVEHSNEHLNEHSNEYSNDDTKNLSIEDKTTMITQDFNTNEDIDFAINLNEVKDNTKSINNILKDENATNDALINISAGTQNDKSFINVSKKQSRSKSRLKRKFGDVLIEANPESIINVKPEIVLNMWATLNEEHAKILWLFHRLSTKPAITPHTIKDYAEMLNMPISRFRRRLDWLKTLQIIQGITYAVETMKGSVWTIVNQEILDNLQTIQTMATRRGKRKQKPKEGIIETRDLHQ